MTVVLIALGAAVGAPLRYLVDRLVASRYDGAFPWGTLLVNVAGSFVLGVMVATAARGRLDDGLVALIGTGFCGALTTYSTFGYETLRLVEGGAMRRAVGNVMVCVTAGLAAAALGWALGG